MVVLGEMLAKVLVEESAVFPPVIVVRGKCEVLIPPQATRHQPMCMKESEKHLLALESRVLFSESIMVRLSVRIVTV